MFLIYSSINTHKVFCNKSVEFEIFFIFGRFFGKKIQLYRKNGIFYHIFALRAFFFRNVLLLRSKQKYTFSERLGCKLSFTPSFMSIFIKHKATEFFHVQMSAKCTWYLKPCPKVKHLMVG